VGPIGQRVELVLAANAGVAESNKAETRPVAMTVALCRRTPRTRERHSMGEERKEMKTISFSFTHLKNRLMGKRCLVLWHNLPLSHFVLLFGFCVRIAIYSYDSVVQQ